MSTDKKVSIITVCYNSEKTIRKTIESVLAQTYKNVEYIIVDGASKDGTVKIIQEYEAAFQGRMRWISEPDEGIYFAMNKGIKMAEGELIGIINSDDYYEEKAVEYMVEAMTEERYQILYGALRMIRDGMEDCISIYSHHFLRRRSIAHPACFVTRALYCELGMYDTKYVSVADYDFMIRMSENDQVHFYPVYRLIANFTAGGMSSTHKAYLDLIRLQRDHGIISQSQYYKIMIKSNIAKFLGH